MTRARTIFRYTLRAVERQTIRMPAGAQILHVDRRDTTYSDPAAGVPREEIQLWALVEPDGPVEDRDIRIVGTGWGVPGVDVLDYLGTVQMGSGTVVWHLFECPR